MPNKALVSLLALMFKVHHRAQVENQTFHKAEVLEMLLMRDTDSINSYLDEFFFQAISQYPLVNWVEVDELYLIPCETSPEKWTYLMGYEILTPYISMPTFDQLHESFAWYKYLGGAESKWCDNLDMWTEFVLSEQINKTYSHAKVLAAPFVLWKEVFLDEGNEAGNLQKILLNQAHSKLRLLRRNLRVMKNKKAPEFLVNLNSKEIRIAREVLQKIERVTLW